MNNRLLLLVGGIALMLGLASCGEYSNTEAGEATCVYNGGFIDSKDFREYKGPGSGREHVGWSSDKFEVPLRLVTFSGLDGADPLAVNVGGMQMFFDYTVRMKFNTELLEDEEGEAILGTAGTGKPAVCELIETQLKPFNATDFNDPDGIWATTWLESRVEPQAEVAGVRALQNTPDPVSIYFNIPPDCEAEDAEEEAECDGTGARDLAATEFGRELTEELNAALGRQFFCGPDHNWLSSACSNVEVVLPQPSVSEADRNILEAPRKARTNADSRVATAEEETRAELAEANEAANRAEGVAAARTRVANSAEEKANADELIAEQEARSIRVEVGNEFIWCEVVRSLGESCWLVAAAQNGGLPAVLGEIPEAVTVTTPIGGTE